MGIHTLHGALRARPVASRESYVAARRRAFLTSLAATASNPVTIASWAAVFAAASAGGVADTPSRAALLVAGVGAGSLAWVTLLAAGTAAARRAVGARAIRLADVVAGLG
jgi:threonine/homoserine/homoserine lactone efflux protein